MIFSAGSLSPLASEEIAPITSNHIFFVTRYLDTSISKTIFSMSSKDGLYIPPLTFIIYSSSKFFSSISLFFISSTSFKNIFFVFPKFFLLLLLLLLLKFYSSCINLLFNFYLHNLYTPLIKQTLLLLPLSLLYK